MNFILTACLIAGTLHPAGFVETWHRGEQEKLVESLHSFLFNFFYSRVVEEKEQVICVHFFNLAVYKTADKSTTLQMSHSWIY